MVTIYRYHWINSKVIYKVPTLRATLQRTHANMLLKRLGEMREDSGSEAGIDHSDLPSHEDGPSTSQTLTFTWPLIRAWEVPCACLGSNPHPPRSPSLLGSWHHSIRSFFTTQGLATEAMAGTLLSRESNRCQAMARGKALGSWFFLRFRSKSDP